jgi:hypothetical protein
LGVRTVGSQYQWLVRFPLTTQSIPRFTFRDRSQRTPA